MDNKEFWNNFLTQNFVTFGYSLSNAADLMAAIDGFHYKRLDIKFGKLRNKLQLETVDTIENDKSSILTEKQFDKLIADLGAYNEYVKVTNELKWVFENNLINIEEFKKKAINRKDGKYIIILPGETLGRYFHREKKIELIKTLNENNLPIVYVHEMMHAYYGKEKPYPYIEESLTEFAMIMFFKAFSEGCKQYEDWYVKALEHVEEKRIAPGLAHYALGAFIAANYSDVLWEKLMKNFQMTTPKKNQYDKYEKKLQYKCLVEEEQQKATDELYKLLTKCNSGVAAKGKQSRVPDDYRRKKKANIDRKLSFIIETYCTITNKDVIVDISLDDNGEVNIVFISGEERVTAYSYVLDKLFKENKEQAQIESPKEMFLLTLDGKNEDAISKITLKVECMADIEKVTVTREIKKMFVPKSIKSIDFKGPRIESSTVFTISYANKDWKKLSEEVIKNKSKETT